MVQLMAVMKTTYFLHLQVWPSFHSFQCREKSIKKSTSLSVASLGAIRLHPQHTLILQARFDVVI